MEAIILAGGFGTRLKHIVSDVAKPMAPINNKPFLVFILDYLKKYNCTKVIVAVGYKSYSIKEYFGNSYNGMDIVYSDEDNPLGTGGAIKKALMNSDKDEIFILNGDTLFDCNLEEMRITHESSNCDITVAVKKMKNYSRYGSVVIEDNKIIKFVEKQKINEGIINAGIYLINKKIFNEIQEDEFSFEEKILESLKYSMCAYESNGYFIDIGVPEDYYKAQKDFANER
jgi:D-glycero-alpha-D-manno-heptose 1-phosphate guanylyltransferase